MNYLQSRMSAICREIYGSFCPEHERLLLINTVSSSSVIGLPSLPRLKSDIRFLLCLSVLSTRFQYSSINSMYIIVVMRPLWPWLQISQFRWRELVVAEVCQTVKTSFQNMKLSYPKAVRQTTAASSSFSICLINCYQVGLRARKNFVLSSFCWDYFP